MTTAHLKAINNTKTSYINKIFSDIATKYDLLNNLMTLGLHYLWKEEAIKLALKETNNIKEALDICTGTGDLAIILNKHCPHANILCIDNSSNMLEIAKTKTNNLQNISLKELDFENLLPEHGLHKFDLITIGFGLRNLSNREKSIEKIFSLLNNSGVFACIDLGYPSNPLWQKIYFGYFLKVIPWLGKIFANNKTAYTYLTDSLASWYKQEELKTQILSEGFSRCYYKNILGGAIAIHIAVK